MLAWHEMRPDGRPLDISVNLSARQVAHRDLVAGVREFIESSGLDPIHLHLEVTESVLVEEQGVVADALREISELGVCLVLDDFGTGYSSLAYLNRFPFDCLKIDRRFVSGLGTEEESSAIVQAILSMATALDLDVVAEGVENETQLEELRRLGCPNAQGFYFSRPVSGDVVTRRLADTGGFPIGPDDGSLKAPGRR
jgi:EAL domain-containing protein (putative c-di-GMP-specific phosphodiesterase class I)